MLGRGVVLQVPGADDPLAAAVDRAAPLFPGLAWVVEAEEGGRLGLTDSRQGMQISTVNRPSISVNGPVKVPQKNSAAPLRVPPARTGSSRSTAKLPWRNDRSRDVEIPAVAPGDMEVLAFEPGCEESCEREVDEVEWQGGRVYLYLGARRVERRQR
jgi:hypothetical protein